MAHEKMEDSALNDRKRSPTYLLLFTFFMNGSWFITVLTSTTSYITISKYLYYKVQSESNESCFLYFMLFTGWTCENFTELPWKQCYFSAQYPPLLTAFICLWKEQIFLLDKRCSPSPTATGSQLSAKPRDWHECPQRVPFGRTKHIM